MNRASLENSGPKTQQARKAHHHIMESSRLSMSFDGNKPVIGRKAPSSPQQRAWWILGVLAGCAWHNQPLNSRSQPRIVSTTEALFEVGRGTPGWHPSPFSAPLSSSHCFFLFFFPKKTFLPFLSYLAVSWPTSREAAELPVPVSSFILHKSIWCPLESRLLKERSLGLQHGAKSDVRGYCKNGSRCSEGQPPCQASLGR